MAMRKEIRGELSSEKSCPQSGAVFPESLRAIPRRPEKEDVPKGKRGGCYPVHDSPGGAATSIRESGT